MENKSALIQVMAAKSRQVYTWTNNDPCHLHLRSKFQWVKRPKWWGTDNRPNSQIPQCTCAISDNVPFRTKSAHFGSEWSIVGYGRGALWNFWSIRSTWRDVTQINQHIMDPLRDEEHGKYYGNDVQGSQKSSYVQESVGWNYLSIPKLQRCNQECKFCKYVILLV